MTAREGDGRLIGLLCAPSSLLAVAAALHVGARGLDVALWAVLTPIAAATCLFALGRVRAHRVRRQRAPVVVPDAVALPRAALDPIVQARAEALEQARSVLLGARDRGADLEELLVLARALHEAELALAGATVAAGGLVPQSLRDELALRDGSPVSAS